MNQELEPTRTQPQLPPASSGVTTLAAPPPSPPAAPPPRRSALRSLFWPGFAAGFLLLSILSCSGLVLATGLNRIDLEDIQGNGVVWTPPAIVPTNTPAVAEAPQSGEGLFTSTESARNITNSRVNIRQTPGHLGKTAADILAQIEPGDTLEILEGPVPADNLTWWRIRYQTPDGRPIEGWVAEATQSGVQILGR
jgi:hypothetical protein